MTSAVQPNSPSPGKSTLATSLGALFKRPGGGGALATPPLSLASLRPVYDRLGGQVARAFYMASNYM